MPKHLWCDKDSPPAAGGNGPSMVGTLPWGGTNAVLSIYLPEQRDELSKLEESQYKFQVFTSTTQDAARMLLGEHDLNTQSLAALESKWKKVWTTNYKRKHPEDKTVQETVVRALYQCACGYDSRARRAQKKRGSPPVEDHGAAAAPGQNSGGTRRAPYNFTGCLAHVHVTSVAERGDILRFVGYLQHNDECRAAQLARFPSIPLRPHVVEIALQQLHSNASVAQIRGQNLELCTKKRYHGQVDIESNPHTTNFRFVIQSDDLRALYRRHYRERFGIDISVSAENNVHNWLDPSSPHYKPEIRHAIFHYAARTEKHERFKIFIATEDMRQAAWKYCHRRQLVIDGTFGLCNSRVLLWIAMGVDESNSGIPVALFLFSAPTGTQATHAGYNTAIIEELLERWRDWLGLGSSSRPTGCDVAADSDGIVIPGTLSTSPEEPFEPFMSANAGQTSVAPFCGGYLGSGINGRKNAFAHSRNLSHNEALRLVAVEEQALATMAAMEGSSESSNMVAAVADYISYLCTQWLPAAMWAGWSRRGREDAAARMGVRIEAVLTTTNHLESLNGRLKNYYIPQWQHSGHRLRLDILIYFLAVDILPRIYGQHQLLTNYSVWKAERFQAAAGGVLLPSPSSRSQNPLCEGSHCSATVSPAFVPRVWYAPDFKRDTDALMLYNSGFLRPIRAGRRYELWANCVSSSSLGSGNGEAPAQHQEKPNSR
ncbi:hypothetical protein C8Q80DRAFT_1305237 [Daedaleopsis nitida]|nr:hypothetical protein C8Q80DRAFT_1305237 [Daedaleopsis nitida]